MPQFAYKARRRSGEVVQGVLDVPDRTAALVQIERLGLFPVMVDGSRGATAAANDVAAEKPKFALLPAVLLKKRQRKPKLQELATFTQQLANLLKCGMPHLSRFASCWVKVASSCSLGLRWRFFRRTAGRSANLGFSAATSLAAAVAPREPSTMTGNNPSRSIWTS